MYKTLLGRSRSRMGSRVHQPRHARARRRGPGSARTSSSRRASHSGTGIVDGEHQSPREGRGRAGVARPESRMAGRSQFNLIRSSGRWQPDRAGRELRDARHRDERPEPENQRRCPRQVGRVRGTEARGTVLYINGAAGNIAPIYSVYPTPSSGHLSQFRVLLGDRILRGGCALGPGTERCDHARWRKRSSRRRAGRGSHGRRSLRAYAAPAATPDGRLPIRFVRINDTVIWSAPVEMFCEIAMDVRSRRRSPARSISGTPTAGSDTCRPRRRSKREATSRRRRRSQRRWKETSGMG